MISSQEKREPLDPKIYAQGMAMLSAVFPAVNLSPEIYYTFLDDLREDNFIGAIKSVCREVQELYPNSNLIAIIRQKAEEYVVKKLNKTDSDKLAIGYEEPDYEQIEKVKSEWYELKNRLAREKSA